MRTKPGIVLQARLNSTRLRAKALEPVGGRTIVEQCLRRLIAAGVGPVILATTWQTEDDALEAIARRVGVDVLRGSTEDVLARLLAASERFQIDPVVRALGDSPAVDVQAPWRVLHALETTGADYVREDGLPLGAGVEAMTQRALRRAAHVATEPFDREHATTLFIRRRDLFHCVKLEAPHACVAPALNLSVDTSDDLTRVRELFFRVRSSDPSVPALIAAARQAAWAGSC
ncbi:MAG: NTP transferase domain-containing protein [Vicinamibacterales bacterium]